jgi:hypothetical protein
LRQPTSPTGKSSKVAAPGRVGVPELIAAVVGHALGHHRDEPAGVAVAANGK